MDSSLASVISGIVTAMGAVACVIIENRSAFKKTREMNDEIISRIERSDAKQTIFQMITFDELNYELFHKLPSHYNDILKEYEIYHNNNGNSDTTEAVENYKIWYKRVEQEVCDKKASN